MQDTFETRINLHQQWVETIYEKGKQLSVDDANFTDYDLTGRLLESAFLSDCLFEYMNLKSVSFHASYLCFSNFSNSTMFRCNFSKTDLYSANFSDASLKNIRFYESNCENTNFTNVSFTGCKFNHAKLYRADFTNCTFKSVNILDAVFDHTIVNGLRIVDLKGFDKAIFKSINIGSVFIPEILKEEEAKEWIRSRIVEEL